MMIPLGASANVLRVFLEKVVCRKVVQSPCLVNIAIEVRLGAPTFLSILVVFTLNDSKSTVIP